MSNRKIVYTEYKTIRDVSWYVEREAIKLVADGWIAGWRHIAEHPVDSCQPIAVQSFTRHHYCDC